MPAATQSVRVTLLDTWDEAVLDLAPETPVAEVRRAVLERGRVRGAPGDYVVKYLGAEVDPARSLAEAGIVPNGALIVLARRRNPAR